MSSQSYNSTSYKTSSLTDRTGISPGFPLRDSSDYTTMIRERSTYRESLSSLNKPTTLISQSNTYNLSYVMGRVECGGCTGGSLMHTRKLGT
jgi:hypothetical protein